MSMVGRILDDLNNTTTGNGTYRSASYWQKLLSVLEMEHKEYL